MKALFAEDGTQIYPVCPHCVIGAALSAMVEQHGPLDAEALMSCLANAITDSLSAISTNEARLDALASFGAALSRFMAERIGLSSSLMVFAAARMTKERMN